MGIENCPGIVELDGETTSLEICATRTGSENR